MSLKAKAGEVALKGLAIAGNMIVGWAIGAVLSTVTKKIEELSNASEIAEENSKAFANSLNNEFSKIADNSSTLSELNEEYQRLSDGVSAFGKNLSLSNSDYERYKEIISQVSEIMPNLTTYFNSQGEAIAFVKGNLGDLTKEYEKYIQMQANMLISNGDENGKTIQDIFDDYGNNSDHGFFEDLKNFFKNMFGSYSLDDMPSNDILDVLEKFQNESRREIANYLTDVDVSQDGLYLQTDSNRAKAIIQSVLGASAKDIAEMSDEEFNELQERIQSNIEVLRSNIDADMSKIHSALTTIAYAKDSFWAIDDESMRDNVTTFLSSITSDMWNGLSVENEAEAREFVSKVIDGFTENKGGFADAFNGLFDPSLLQLPAREYEEKIQEFLDTISEYFGFDEEGRKTFLISLGIETDGTDRLNKSIAQIGEKENSKTADSGVGALGAIISEISPTTIELTNYTKDLTEDQIELWLEATNGAQSAEEAISSYEDALKEVKSAEFPTLSDTEILSQIQSLSGGFDQLDKIYADVYDKGDFDWSSILNNDEFMAIFSGMDDAVEEYKNAYSNFIETVRNSPSDIGACQSAFDQLASAYLYNSGVLQDVTDSTKNTTIAMLEQMGVLNAEEIVSQQLISSYDGLREAADSLGISKQNLSQLTQEEILQLLNEGIASDDTRNRLIALYVAQLDITNNPVNTAASINNILGLMDASSSAASALSKLAIVMQRISNYQKILSTATGDTSLIEIQLKAAQRQADRLKNKASEALQKNVSVQTTTPVNYGGGSSYRTAVNKGNSGKSGGSSSPSSTKTETSKEPTPKSFDWIEISLNRIKEAFERVKKTASSVYNGFYKRNTALVQEMENVRQQIDLNKEAYQGYMDKANSVGLSDYYKNLVQNGAISVDEITDDDLKEQIDSYKEWYEKAIECKDAIQELNETIADLYKNRFDDIESHYENQLSLLEHLTTTYDNGISDLEERGYLASTKFYEELQKVEMQNIDTQRIELDDLIRSMSEAMNSGFIEEGSDAWYEFQKSINEVKESIQESETSLVEFANKIREIKWDHFDYLQERISEITDEADFLIDLMDHTELYTDNGQFTDTGMSTMGLHGQNYNVYMAQADRYAEEIKKLQAEIASDPNNTKLLDRYNELLEAQRDSILAAEDEKDAIVDMVREGIELELDALKELITSYTDALDSAKDLYDYQKKVKDQTSEISRLQKQLTAYQGDTSEETRAIKQKIEVELKDAMESLEDTQYEHYISEQKKLLDNLYDEYELILNQRLDNIDALIGDMIDNINAHATNINATITAQTDKVGYDITECTKAIWAEGGGAYSVITKYGESFTSALTSVNNVLNGISANVGAMKTNSDNAAAAAAAAASATTETDESATPPVTADSSSSSSSSYEYSGSSFYSTPSTANSVTVGSTVNAGNAPIYESSTSTTGSHQYFADDPVYTVIGERGDSVLCSWHGANGEATGWFKKSDLTAYKTGGLVNYTGLAQLDGTPSKPEAVLNAKDTANFIALRDAMSKIANGQSLLSALFGGNGAPGDILGGFANVGASMGRAIAIDNVNYEVNIPIDHVSNYEDFMNQMRKDGKFENMLQAMTIDRLVGKSKISKNQYQW